MPVSTIVVWAFDNGTLFGIHQHDQQAPDERFTEIRVGLDHVGFGCANRAELESWVDRLNTSASSTAASSTRATARA